MFQFIAKEELEKNERTQMKQLTLEINERQEEEELQVKFYDFGCCGNVSFMSPFSPTCIDLLIA